jgi:hypothetical protein
VAICAADQAAARNARQLSTKQGEKPMIRFWELERCAGVDEDYKPFPGMVVPFGGSNVVVLDTNGTDLKVAAKHRGVEIEEFDATELTKKLAEKKTELSKPAVDTQLRDSLIPTLPSQYTKPRFFRIHGKKHTIDFPGELVEAKAGDKVATALRVVVLDAMSVKIAIRNVRVHDDQGNIVFHPKTQADPAKERDGMNAVWAPQANLTFDLIASEPALLDDRDKETRLALGKGFGLRDPDTAMFPPEIDPPKVQGAFEKYLVDGSDATFFVVDKIRGGDSGRTLPTFPVGMCFIRSNHGLTTFAHEAGHYLGGERVAGGWKDLTHTVDQDKGKDVRMLMRDGGAGWKIPFDLTEKFRGFFKRHSAKPK